MQLVFTLAYKMLPGPKVTPFSAGNCPSKMLLADSSPKLKTLFTDIIFRKCL